MYFATLSDLAKEPVFIWVDCVATARSAINVSSVSPDLWEIMVLKLFFFQIFLTLYIGINLIGGERGLISYFEKNRFRSDIETVKELDVLGEYKSEFIECFLSKCEENYSSYFVADTDEDGCVMLAEECSEEILEYYE